ncbi:DNA primase DnaG [Halomarina oriensis]|uniref:DNA primase DnaG n=1 Tax=Halomarina oriensis TaxID=671145 RepID=A0A6B0GJV2_9EURY|nr:DNA primase DnaG [Halomarina oriensis]MWG34141.1 DNA primase [Halomarina oriensis]
MQDTAKYLIHADITAEGVVERSDVVGAIFGQTEGLLGDELDLRDLQDSSKVGRIDVSVDSQNGQSFGTVTIASGLDQVETAILAASLETIERVGPCRATISIDRIEDVRAAKRRAVVDRAKSLLAESFDGSMLTSEELVEEVRRAIRVEDITTYEGLPAGPRVLDSDAIIVVEGRADVLTLLRYGVKNAIAVEGTNVPDAVADLTHERITTTFLDGDRGGDLILKELAQVGEVDYVALAPGGKSVEDLGRAQVMRALRKKVSYESVAEADTVREAFGETTLGEATAEPQSVSDGGSTTADPADDPTAVAPAETNDTADGPTAAVVARAESGAAADSVPSAQTDADTLDDGATDPATEADDEADDDTESAEAAPEAPARPETLRGHVQAVVTEDTDSVRLLDEEMSVLDERPAAEAFDAVRETETVPFAVVLDADLPQRVLDVCAQRGVDNVVARGLGEFVKRPASVRVRTAERMLAREY